MHQYPILTNKVSMEILNLKVVDSNWFSKLFKFKFSNFNLVTISGVENVTNFKVACGYPTLFFNIERMVCGSVDSFTVKSGNVKNFIGFLDLNVNISQLTQPSIF